MSYTDEFRAFASRHGVSSDAITRIMWNMQPSFHIYATDEGAVEPGEIVVGYVGGLPELPADTEWDPGHHFVAALDLAALPKQPLDAGLPREGHLLFFAFEDYHAEDGVVPVIHVPPETGTAVRPVPVGESWDGEPYELEPLRRQVLVCDPGTSWDVLGWMWDPEVPEEGQTIELLSLDEEINEEEREGLGLLLAAVREYAERTGTLPRVERNGGLRGVEMNPPYYRAVYDAEFLRKCEEAVVVCRDTPERFEELYARAMAEAATKEGGPWLNLLELTQADVFDWGDGEVGWIINRDDLLAQRFDRVRQAYNC
ncbi:DUF1963 domain-containing protein [Streptomyces sp. NRRL S-37]|uniref:DUF1963 domain-containing protein n=1 Tax=Streptomyces sp. NRRL S-37 TaxID=1463903 RepID=UPI00068CE177|nr:DUF1963 domain-containing protein [Streptomyces sp. NRRL S-37]